MAEQMAPAINAENLEKRTVALPPSLWQACEEIAADNGEKLSEIYRRIFNLGISAERERRTADLSYENKRLVNERLKAKRDGAIDALHVLEALPDETVQPAIAAIRQWLDE